MRKTNLILIQVLQKERLDSTNKENFRDLSEKNITNFEEKVTKVRFVSL